MPEYLLGLGRRSCGALSCFRVLGRPGAKRKCGSRRILQEVPEDHHPQRHHSEPNERDPVKSGRVAVLGCLGRCCFVDAALDRPRLLQFADRNIVFAGENKTDSTRKRIEDPRTTAAAGVVLLQGHYSSSVKTNVSAAAHVEGHHMNDAELVDAVPHRPLVCPDHRPLKLK